MNLIRYSQEIGKANDIKGIPCIGIFPKFGLAIYGMIANDTSDLILRYY